jgi:hypothetical protein
MILQAGMRRQFNEDGTAFSGRLLKGIRSLAMAAATGFLGVSYGEGFDSYSTVEDSHSVMISEGFVPPPSGYEAGGGGFGYEGLAACHVSCQGNCNRGCPRCQDCPEGSTGMFNHVLGDACPRLTAQVDALMLWQSNIPSQTLLVVGPSATAPTFLDANQLITDMAVGPRAALMLHLDQESAIEANYFYVGSISSTRELNAPGAGPADKLAWASLAGLPFGDIDDGVIVSNGEIQSFELNWRQRHCGSPISWLVGFRWVEWNQSLTLSDNFSSFQGFGSDVLTSQTENDMYGAQFGLDAILLTLWDAIRFNGIAKAGIYGNQAAATTAVTTDRPVVLSPQFSDSRTQTGFFGELGINGSLRLTDHFFWRAGYNFFWLSGVAIPTEQLPLVNLTAIPAEGSISAGSSVFLHGVNTGIEFIW